MGRRSKTTQLPNYLSADHRMEVGLDFGHWAQMSRDDALVGGRGVKKEGTLRQGCHGQQGSLREAGSWCLFLPFRTEGGWSTAVAFASPV